MSVRTTEVASEVLSISQPESAMPVNFSHYLWIRRHRRFGSAQAEKE
jgi:hypothetical protein